MSTFIGIDPGKTGAITIESAPGKVEVCPMPLIGKELDVRGISDIFADLARTGHTADCFAMLEKQQVVPGNGSLGNFATGYCYGVIKAMLTAHCIPFEVVSPMKWKNSFGVSSPKKARIKKDKNAPPVIETPESKKSKFAAKRDARSAMKAQSILKAQQLFPGVNLVVPGKKTPSDGVAEALLIMEYGKRVKNK